VQLGFLVRGRDRHPQGPAAVPGAGPATARQAVGRSIVRRCPAITRRSRPSQRPHMIQRLFSLIALTALLALVGCAHPISLTADAAPLVGIGGNDKIDRTAVLVVTDAQLAQEVVGPGGGGDKVSYKPYK